MTKKGVRNISKCLLFALLISMCSIHAIAIAVDFNAAMLSRPEIQAESAILIDSKRGQILYSKFPDKKLHVSTANKLISALVVIENTKLDSKVTISKESVEVKGSALRLEVGSKYSVEELLYAIMLTTANDAAYALAEYTGGDIPKFIEMMNSKASALNLKNTHFTNPTGLYDEFQYTTAYDLSMLIKFAINNSTFNRLFATSLKPWIDSTDKSNILKSQNDLFWSYEGVDGGKTGYNIKEFQSAVTTASRSGQRLICVVLDSPGNSIFADSTALFDFGFLNFKTGILVKKGDPQKSISVGDEVVNLVSSNDIYYTHPIGDSYIQSFEVKPVDDIAPPIQKNRIIGTARYILQDNTIIDFNLYPDKEIFPTKGLYSSITTKIAENKDILLLVAFLLFIEFILILAKIFSFIKKRSKRNQPNNS